MHTEVCSQLTAMMTATRFFLRALTLVLMTSSVTSRPHQVVDLTHTLGLDTVFWPGQPRFNLTVLHKGIFKTNLWLEMNFVGFGEHGGTHIDAPAHLTRGGWHNEDIPASHLVGPGVMVDLREKVKADDAYPVTKEDFMNWEAEHGRIPDSAVVLLNFGWSQRYPNPRLVFQTDTPDDTTTYRFPALSAEAAAWLAEDRNLTALGIETASPDFPDTTTYPAHTSLLGRSILILEFVANVNSLPPRGFDVIIGVLKVRSGTGGAARILAVMDDDSSGAISEVRLVPWKMVVLTVVLGERMRAVMMG